MNKQNAIDRANVAFDEKRYAIEQAAAASENAIAAKVTLERAKLSAAETEGYMAMTNDKTRAAFIQSMTKDEAEAVRTAEVAVREAQTLLDLANLRVAQISMLVKIETEWPKEIVQTIVPQGDDVPF